MPHARHSRMAVLTVLAVSITLGLPGPAETQQSKLGSIDAYLMDRATEIALAKSAGPRGIGDGATVWVLTRDGYQVATQGTNGFACFVGRGWSGPATPGTDGRLRLSPGMLDPMLKAPHCFNEAAAKSVLPMHMLVTTSLIEGAPIESIRDKVDAALRDGRLRAPGDNAMAYMTSPHQYLGREFGSWHPHVMLYIPYLTDEAWGARGLSDRFPFVAEASTPWAVTIIPLSTFSDGSTPRPPGTR